MKGSKKTTLQQNDHEPDNQILKTQSKKTNSWLIMSICTGLALWFSWIVIRGGLIGYTLKLILFYPPDIPRIILASHYDFLLVLGLTTFFIAIGFLTRKNELGTTITQWTFFVTGFISQVFGIFSGFFAWRTGGVITYQWLVYSDFLSNSDSQNAILASIDAQFVWGVLAFSTLFILVAYGINKLVYYFKISSYLPLIMGMVTVAFIPASVWHFSKRPWKGIQLINPPLAFAQSLPMFQEKSGLFTMELSKDALNEQVELHRAPQNLPLIDSSASIKNVIVLVLESVPAEYLEVYGSRFPATPNIKRFKDRSLQVDYAYAHTPSTNRAMFATLSAMYPKISFNSITKNHTKIKTPTISSELEKQGYRTSFFTSADNRFQDVGDFLGARKFHAVRDYRSIECDSENFNASITGWKYLDGMEDLCVGGEFEQWLEESPEKPFFSMLWTVQTHYPYYTTGKIDTFETDNYYENLYLNSLKAGDSLFGKVMDLLIEKGLDDETLVVLMGDHGESFGKHNQTGHANEIYEENVKIPLIFYNPNLYRGESLNRIVGEIDIAPTIFHILNKEAPEEWQGQSMLSENFRNSVFMFSPYSRFVFGYRYDNYKIIYDAGLDFFEVYDLQKDSLEITNIAGQVPEITKDAHQKLGAWVQYHEQTLAPKLK